MKHIILFYPLIIFSVFFVTCSNKSELNDIGKVEFITFKVSMEHRLSDEKILCSLLKKEHNDYFLYDYKCITKKDFRLLFHKKLNLAKIITNESDTLNLTQAANKIYYINNKKYEVIKFITNIELIDGMKSVFFCKDFGLMIEYVNTWSSGIKLSSYSDFNEIITELISKIIADDAFFKEMGIPAPPPLPAEEYDFE